MRCPSFLGMTLAVVLLAASALLAGCRVEPDETAGPAHDVSGDDAATDAESTDAAEEAVDEESPLVDDPAMDDPAPNAGEATPPGGVAGSPATGYSSPAKGQSPAGVDIRLPGDFQRPTLPDATLAESVEPAEPPVEVTDRSAEADEPGVLPGDVQIDDLFESLDSPQAPAP